MLPFPMARRIPPFPSPPPVSSSSLIPTDLLGAFAPPQRSNLSALCFHNLRNPSSHLPADIDFYPLYFHNLTNCFSCKSFILITIRVARGCHPKQFSQPLHSPCGPPTEERQTPFFDIVTNSLSSPKNLFILKSTTSTLFWQNTRVGVGSVSPPFAINDTLTSRVVRLINANMTRLPTMALGSAFCLLASSTTAHQAKEAPPQNSNAKIQVNVNAVLVPVVVRDAQGRAIGNLKKEDFQIFDKDKPQTLSGFSIQKRAAIEANPTSAPAVANPPSTARLNANVPQT